MYASPLCEVQRALGAVFTTCGDCVVAADYGDLNIEYGAAVQSCVAIDLSPWGKLRVSGEDRRALLDRRLTCDVEHLDVGQGAYAAALDRHGRLLADAQVYALEDSHLLQTRPEAAYKLADALAATPTEFRIHIQDLRAAWGLVSLQGPESAAALGYMGVGVPAEGAIVSELLGGHPVLIAGHRRSALPGFDMFAAAGSLVDCWNSIMECGVRPSGLSALDVLRIEAGIPCYGIDLNERVTLFEAGLEGAVPEGKRGYVGEEAVASARRRGQPPRRLRGILLSGDRVPRKGADVWAGERRVGCIASAAYSPGLEQAVALAFLRRGFTDPGLKVQVAAEGGLVEGEVVVPPFAARPVPKERRVLQTAGV